MVKKMTWAVRTPQICLGFVLLVIGYVMFAMTNFSVFDAIKGPVELTAEMSLQEMEGQYVSYEVKYPLGTYMEETVTKKVNGVSTGTSRSRLGYIVYDENREDFLAVECAVKQEDEMEDLADQFWAALDGQGDVAETGIVIKGSLELLMGEDLRYYKKNLGSVLDEVPESAYVITGGKIKGDKIGEIQRAGCCHSCARNRIACKIFLQGDQPERSRLPGSQPSVQSGGVGAGFCRSGETGEYMGRQALDLWYALG